MSQTKHNGAGWALITTRTPMALALTTLMMAACGGGGQNPAAGESAAPAGDSVIRIDGSSTVFPVTEAVAEEFQKANPGLAITVGISGTGGGFQKFCRDEIDIADASRPIIPVGEGRVRRRPASSTSSCRSPTTAWRLSCTRRTRGRRR